MKHLKTFENFKYLKPNSDEDILNKLKQLPLKRILYESITNGFIKGVEYCLKEGINVNIRYQDHETPLQLSSQNGNINICELLIKNGADVNSEDIYLNTPLLEASSIGHLKICELLIKNGADINSENCSKKTPLYVSVFNGYYNVTKLLLENGADYTITDNRGHTPLDILQLNYKKIPKNKKEKILDLLLKYINKTNNNN